jgi:apolipoprotein D and lipocalin family protein
MAASLDDLKNQIEAAERNVHAADARAAESARVLKAHWRARGPSILVGSASALLAWQLLSARRKSHRYAYAPPKNAWMRTIDPLLRYGGPKLVTVISALVAGLVAKKTHKPLATAPNVDYERFAGTWYEIARLPARHEKDCVSDVTVTYELTIDGGLRVTNRCRRRDGSMKRTIARAEAVDPDTNAKLRVSLMPQLLDSLPFVWSEYCIIDVASDYSTAVVGTPDRSGLWLLARDATVSEEVRSAFIAKALGQGFDTSELVYCPHTGSGASASDGGGGGSGGSGTSSTGAGTPSGSSSTTGQVTGTATGTAALAATAAPAESGGTTGDASSGGAGTSTSASTGTDYDRLAAISNEKSQ